MLSSITYCDNDRLATSERKLKNRGWVLIAVSCQMYCRISLAKGHFGPVKPLTLFGKQPSWQQGSDFTATVHIVPSHAGQPLYLPRFGLFLKAILKSDLWTKPSGIHDTDESTHTHTHIHSPIHPRCFPQMEGAVSGSLSVVAAGAENPVYHTDRLNATEQDNVMEFIAARHSSSEGCCCWRAGRRHWAPGLLITLCNRKSFHRANNK